jgi:hypothetical protein
MVGASGRFTHTCTGTGKESVCVTGTVFRGPGTSALTNVQCWDTWDGMLPGFLPKVTIADMLSPGSNWVATNSEPITTSTGMSNPSHFKPRYLSTKSRHSDCKLSFQFFGSQINRSQYNRRCCSWRARWTGPSHWLGTMVSATKTRTNKPWITTAQTNLRCFWVQ